MKKVVTLKIFGIILAQLLMVVSSNIGHMINIPILKLKIRQKFILKGWGDIIKSCGQKDKKSISFGKYQTKNLTK